MRSDLIRRCPTGRVQIFTGYIAFSLRSAVSGAEGATPALPHGTSIEDRNFRGFSYTMTYNVLGWPAVSVPFGRSSNGLPIGVQIACKPWRDDLALAIAQNLESAGATL